GERQQAQAGRYSRWCEECDVGDESEQSPPARQHCPSFPAEPVPAFPIPRDATGDGERAAGGRQSRDQGLGARLPRRARPRPVQGRHEGGGWNAGTLQAVQGAVQSGPLQSATSQHASRVRPPPVTLPQPVLAHQEGRSAGPGPVLGLVARVSAAGRGPRRTQPLLHPTTLPRTHQSQTRALAVARRGRCRLRRRVPCDRHRPPPGHAHHARAQAPAWRARAAVARQARPHPLLRPRPVRVRS
ncbi:hypothetical protein AURDEDRAFT_149444, partial [Auricularia subglabra TFB-10046 SS5]